MRVRVITPAMPVVTKAAAKHHLRIDAAVTDDDEYITGLIAAAQAWIDGPAGWLGRSIGPQLLELVIEQSCSPVVPLPYGPVLAVEAAWSGEEAEPVDGYVTGSPGFSFGTAMTSGLPIRILYWAGYGKPISEPEPDGPIWTAEAPAPIKHAILLLVGQWFMTREAVNVGNIVNAMPFAVEALLQPYRVWR